MITIDFETKSYADLKKVGAWAYSEDPTTDVICACWGIDSEPIQEWWPGKNKNDNIPWDLWKNLNHQGTDAIEAHNVAFERSIWANVLVPKYDWPVLGDDQWRDTMAVACYLALPASLDRLSRALGYGPKDPEGGRLITRYSKLHLKTARTEIPGEDFHKFVAYCRDDVQREQAIGDELGDLPERELRVFLLSQKVNMRGIPLDREGIAAATAVADERAGELEEEFRKITGLRPSQRDKVMRWCDASGVKLDNLQGAYIEDLLTGGELPHLPLLDALPQGQVRRVLEIRRAISRASTKKLDAMARQCGSDGRARFQTRYHGAVTGRETGTGFQPLNLHRGDGGQAPEQLVRDIMYRDPAYLDAVYGDATDAVARASRHWIRAEEGKRIVAGDYSSVEAVVLACLAGEQWKVDAFARGDPIYEIGACNIHELLQDALDLARKDKEAFRKMYPKEAKDGKTRELACGYQGALGAWLKFDNSGRHSDEEIIEMVKGWRGEHPAIVSFWRLLEDAAFEAVRYPDRTIRIFGPGKPMLCFQTQEEWLTMILPNGKRLWYRDPQLRQTMPQWHQPETKEDCASGKCDCRPRVQVTYMAQKMGQWLRVHTYGGKLAENATQAACRELLVNAAERVEKAGYPIILTVYDEIVTECPEGFGSAAELGEIMCDLPDWAVGWPITASVWEGDRYRK